MGEQCEYVRWPAFLRLDRAELEGATMVVRATSPRARDRRRRDAGAPLGYLYAQAPEPELDSDLRLFAGHYDPVAAVWSFSGEVAGITGITEPPPSCDAAPEGPIASIPKGGIHAQLA